jgi:hypothetical protein
MNTCLLDGAVHGVNRLGLVVFCVWSAAGWAAHPLVTEDTGTQGVGKFQVEAQFERARDNAEGVTETTTGFASVVSYGFHERADVIVTLPYARVEVVDDTGAETAERGRGDVALDAKWRFFEADSVSLALKSGLTFATGDEQRGLGAGKTNASVLLIGSCEHESFALHATAGVIGNRNIADEKTRLWQVSVGGWISVGDVKLAADLGRYTNAERGADKDPAFGILGVIYSPREDLDLDLGVQWGLSDPETDRVLLAGVTLRY